MRGGGMTLTVTLIVILAIEFGLWLATEDALR